MSLPAPSPLLGQYLLHETRVVAGVPTDCRELFPGLTWSVASTCSCISSRRRCQVSWGPAARRTAPGRAASRRTSKRRAEYTPPHEVVWTSTACAAGLAALSGHMHRPAGPAAASCHSPVIVQASKILATLQVESIPIEDCIQGLRRAAAGQNNRSGFRGVRRVSPQRRALPYAVVRSSPPPHPSWCSVVGVESTL